MPAATDYSSPIGAPGSFVGVTVALKGSFSSRKYFSTVEVATEASTDTTDLSLAQGQSSPSAGRLFGLSRFSSAGSTGVAACGRCSARHIALGSSLLVGTASFSQAVPYKPNSKY